MIKAGKTNAEWLKVRRKWIIDNPPNHEGAYLCGVCKKPVHYLGMELHHVYGRKGELLSNVSHFVPTHGYCNQKVGSERGVRNVSKAEYDFRRLLDL